MNNSSINMSEERKKVSPEQLRIIIEELESDRTLVSGREGRAKPDHLAKWEQLAKKLNSVESGAIKNVSKWQQSLRDWKNNTKKKVTKLEASKYPQGDSNQDLTNLEHRLMALYDNEVLPTKRVGIDVSSIAEVDPLSSENSCDEDVPYPSTITTYTCNVSNENSADPIEPTEGDQFKVKRRRVHVMSQDLIDQQNRLLERLASLEASRQDSENRQNKLLEAVAVALEQHAAASAGLARAADAQAHVMTRLLEALRDKTHDGTST